jgi:hypothetical protein
LLSVLAVRDRRMKPLLAFNLLFLTVSLVSPGQASYHYVFLIPGMAMLAASGRKNVQVLAFVCVALIGSNVFGAATWAVLALWAGFIWWIRPRVRLPAVAVIVVLAAVASYSEMNRWHADEADRAVIAAPEQHGYVEVEPRVNSDRLEFKSMVASGWVTRSIALRHENTPPPASERWMVYSTFERGNWDVGVKDMSTGQTRLVTSSLANDSMPVLSPDGREVFFVSDRRRGFGFTAIYRVPLQR